MIGWGHPESLKDGDSHYWGVWWGNEPFSIYNSKVGRFMTEYGFQGFPPFQSLRTATHTNYLDMKWPAFQAKEQHPKGFAIIDEYMKREYNEAVDFKSYAYLSELLQAEGMKVAIEAHRRAKPYCMGSLFWQYNDSWPGITWSSIDYYGRRKALLFFAEHAFADILVSPIYHDGKVTVTIVSDEMRDRKAALRATLMDFNGKVLWKRNSDIDIEANSSKVVMDTTLSRLAPKIDLQKSLLAFFVVSGNDTIARNILYFDEVKNLKLDSAAVQRLVTQVPEGFRVEIRTDKLAKNVCMTSPFVRGEFSDNFFDLLPGEKRTILYKTDINNPNFGSFLRLQTVYTACKRK